MDQNIQQFFITPNSPLIKVGKGIEVDEEEKQSYRPQGIKGFGRKSKDEEGKETYFSRCKSYLENRAILFSASDIDAQKLKYLGTRESISRFADSAIQVQLSNPVIPDGNPRAVIRLNEFGLNFRTVPLLAAWSLADAKLMNDNISQRVRDDAISSINGRYGKLVVEKQQFILIDALQNSQKCHCETLTNPENAAQIKQVMGTIQEDSLCRDLLNICSKYVESKETLLRTQKDIIGLIGLNPCTVELGSSVYDKNNPMDTCLQEFRPEPANQNMNLIFLLDETIRGFQRSSCPAG